MFGAGTRTAVAAVAVGLAVATAAPASAASVGPPITSGLAGPLGLALGPGGERDIYVSQAFAGLLTRVKGGEATNIHTEPGAEIAGVAVEADGSVVYTRTTYLEAPPGTEGPPVPNSGLLKRIAPNGKVSVLGNPFRYEQRTNVDRRQTYGFLDLADECRAQVPAEAGGQAYTGQVDSHPYAVVSLGGGAYAVADAGANAIFRVKGGEVRTIAVLPPQPVVATAEAAAVLGLPSCVIGKTYAFEPVPTDVEVGPNGQLYVTTLPGGPEDEALGARGSVYRVDPDSGRTRRIGTGFLGATGLAVTPEGRVYVAELFGGRVSRLVDGRPVKVVDVDSPAALEFHRGSLYATTEVFAAGNVVRIRL